MGCSLNRHESWGAKKTVEFFEDFELPRHFNIAIQAAKTALKHQWKSSTTLANPRKHHWNCIYKERKTNCSLSSMQNWTHSVFSFSLDENGSCCTSLGYVTKHLYMLVNTRRLKFSCAETSEVQKHW